MEYPIGKGAAANKALKPLSELEPPDGRALHPQRPQGRRADAAGGPALSTLYRRGTPAHGRGASRARPPARARRAVRARRAARARAAAVRGRLHRQHRLGPGVGPGVRGRGSPSCCATPAGSWSAAWRCSIVHRHRRRLAGRAHRRCPGGGSGTCLLVAPLAVPAFVNSFGWVSLTSRVEGFGGAAADRRRCPTTRWSTCPSPPRCAAWTRRWRRPRARLGHGPLAHLLRG